MVRSSIFSARSSVGLAAGCVAVSIIIGGCSADVGRFDSPFLGLNDSGSSTTNAAPVPVQGLGGSTLSQQSPETGRSSPGGAYFPPSSGRSNDAGVKVSALPDPAQPTTVAPLGPTARLPVPPRAAVQPAAPRTQPPIARGETIEVQPGDTLYGLSRRHHVSVDELTKLNSLPGPALRPGQKLVLPAGATRTAKAAPTPNGASALPAVASPAASVTVQPAVAGVQIETAANDGTYTIKPGDSLYVISRTNKVSVEELKRINNITDERRVRPGTVIRMRGAAPETTVAAAPPAVTPPSTPPRIATPTEPRVEPVAQTPALSTQPTIINAPPKQVAGLDRSDTATDVSASEATAAVKPKAIEVANAATQAGAAPLSKFRWPAKGRILSGFGPRADGTSNDGVDISVPMGTDVVAAEAGVVAYAGSELKGFGNLLLVRHDNGWVTAYAHNETLLAKRGDKVRRGQSIAKAGKSGQADQPMVHFEIRQGSKPVDPMPFMEKM